MHSVWSILLTSGQPLASTLLCLHPPLPKSITSLVLTSTENKPPGSHKNSNRSEPDSARWRAGCGECSLLFSQTLNSSWFFSHPLHMRALTRAHTHSPHTHTALLTSFCRDGAFPELSRPNHLVSLQPPHLQLRQHLGIMLLCKYFPYISIHFLHYTVWLRLQMALIYLKVSLLRSLFLGTIL